MREFFNVAGPVLVMCVPLIWVVLRFFFKSVDHPDSVKLFCTTCHHVGVPETKQQGSGWITFVLLLCYVLPGALYALWRSSTKHNVCEKCGSKLVVPLSSPVYVQASGGSNLGSPSVG